MAEDVGAPSSPGGANAEPDHGLVHQNIEQAIDGPSHVQSPATGHAVLPTDNELGESSVLPNGQGDDQIEGRSAVQDNATVESSLDAQHGENGHHPPDDQEGGHGDTRADAGSDDGLFVQQEQPNEVEIKDEDVGDAGNLNLNQHPDHQAQNEHQDLPEKEEDGDDECMIIDSTSVPQNIMAKFAASRFGAHGDGEDIICTGSVKIKVEESSSEDDTASVFQGNEDDNLSDGERPRKRRRPASKRQGKQKARQVQRKQKDTNVGSQHKIREWQEPTEEELMQLQTQYEQLSAQKAKGPLNLGQMVALTKVSARLAIIEEMVMKQANESGNSAELLDNGRDEDLAVEAAVSQDLARYNMSPIPAQLSQGAPARVGSVVEPEGIEPDPEQASNNTNEKTRRPPPKSAKEYWERRYAENDSTRDTGAERPGKRKRSAQGKRKNGKKDAARQNQLVRMLQDSNPIAARAAQGHMAMPGPIQAKRQDDQLRAMKAFLFKISSNPHGRDKTGDMRLITEATRSFGSRQVNAADGQWKLKGMISPLYNHQLVGVRWMLGQEFSPDGPWGGILGDQMGLGKTVQVLATMSANRPSPEDIQAGRHQTLIVAPAVAITQWTKEIEKHCDKTFIKKIHHYKARQKLPPWMWKSADIILASYNEVANAYPSEKTLKRIAGLKLDEQEWAEEFENELGELFGNDFFRVVLDEGHAIRNHNKKTALACFNLSSKQRWILSGTPLHNSVDELYSYFRFLGCHWAEDHDEFSKQFGNIEKDDVQGRLEAIVSSIMLRRRVDDHFAGAPILQIPRTHEPRIVCVDLTQEERLFYKRLESRFRDNMSTHLKNASATKKLQTYLAYLTRLRQAVGHTYMLEGVMQQNFTLEDLNYLKRHLAKLGNTPMHRQVQRWVDMEYEAKEGEDATESRTFGKSRFGIEFNMDSQLADIEAGKSMIDVTCRICYDLPVEPKITECGHTFCRDCIFEALVLSESCPSCKNVLHRVESLKEPERTPADHIEDAEELELPKKKKKKKTAREIGDDENWIQPKLKDSHKWIAQYDKNYPQQVLVASAKTIAVKNQILIWQKEAPDDKIIVFVEWSKMAAIIGRMLYEEELRFLYYVGDMNTEQKNAAITDFEERPDVKILIASIKCGGQALNLNFANRVISVDLWWNTAVENQAFGRVHRIGQLKETHFVKIVIKDSIDERILQMQHDKAKIISKALQEDERHKTQPTLDELVRLFGADANDNGEAGVIVIDDDEDGDD